MKQKQFELAGEECKMTKEEIGLFRFIFNNEKNSSLVVRSIKNFGYSFNHKELSKFIRIPKRKLYKIIKKLNNYNIIKINNKSNYKKNFYSLTEKYGNDFFNFCIIEENK